MQPGGSSRDSSRDADQFYSLESTQIRVQMQSTRASSNAILLPRVHHSEPKNDFGTLDIISLITFNRIVAASSMASKSRLTAGLAATIRPSSGTHAISEESKGVYWSTN